MESLERSKAVIELGKQIVDELMLADDLTAQWMAHLVAEKISAAENMLGIAQSSAVMECVDLVLKLWAHRYSLPPHMQPLRKLDPLLHTLNSLVVNESDEFRFFTRLPANEELEGATEDEKKLFEFAINIDLAARELIRYALSVAADRSVEALKPWLKNAVKGGLEATVEVRVSKFITEGQLENQAKANRQAVLDRANWLESFAEGAMLLAGEMKRTLTQNCPPLPNDSDPARRT